MKYWYITYKCQKHIEAGVFSGDTLMDFFIKYKDNHNFEMTEDSSILFQSKISKKNYNQLEPKIGLKRR